MNSKKLQMLTAVAASILLGIGLATVPASAKTSKESSAYSAQASSNEKKPSKKAAKAISLFNRDPLCKNAEVCRPVLAAAAVMAPHSPDGPHGHRLGRRSSLW